MKKIILTGLIISVLFCTVTPAKAGLDELILDSYNHVYIVRPGDTLTTIAEKFGVEVFTLAKTNHLTNWNLILEGSTLIVPRGMLEHLVQPGETLSSIAEHYRTTVSQLAVLNEIADENVVMAGENLLIPQFSPGLSIRELGWPVTGWISSGFGMREGRLHEGIDIAAEEGEPVRAACSGQVVFAGPRGTYGMTVIINHGNGLETLYAHLSTILVREGEWVRENELIARVGNTGRSTGPHLHLEVRLNGTPYDPMLFLEKMYA